MESSGLDWIGLDWSETEGRKSARSQSKFRRREREREKEREKKGEIKKQEYG